MTSYFTDISDARTRAEALGLSVLVALDDAALAGRLLLASIDLDAGGPWQGRKYDPAQEHEFPRIDGASGTWPYDYYLARTYPWMNSGVTVWDWDTTTSEAVVPEAVLIAVLLTAAVIGERDERMQAIADGLSSQSTGSLSEAYAAAGGKVSPLPVRARAMMERYRLRSGKLL